MQAALPFEKTKMKALLSWTMYECCKVPGAKNARNKTTEQLKATIIMCRSVHISLYINCNPWLLRNKFFSIFCVCLHIIPHLNSALLWSVSQHERWDMSWMVRAPRCKYDITKIWNHLNYDTAKNMTSPKYEITLNMTSLKIWHHLKYDITKIWNHLNYDIAKNMTSLEI